MAATRPTHLYFTGDDEADRFLAEEPLALLVGFVLDQQVTVQKAFAGPARAPAPARHVRRRGHRRDRPGRAGGDLPAEAGHPPLPGEHGRARAGALRRGRRGLRRTGRARLARRRERRGSRAPPARPPRDRPDEGAVAARHPRQALRRAAAGLGGRRPDAPDARRRRLLRGARGLPGEEARPQGGHARRPRPPASRRRRGPRPAPRAPSRARSRGAGPPACPRRSA